MKTRSGAALAIEIEQASDLELVSLARDGNERAFEEIVRRYSGRVFRIASKFFRQRALVEDASQEAFLKAYTQLSTYEGRGSFEGWLTRITTNQCINMLRSAKRRPELAVSDLTQDEGLWLRQSAGNGFDWATPTQRARRCSVGPRREGIRSAFA